MNSGWEVFKVWLNSVFYQARFAARAGWVPAIYIMFEKKNNIPIGESRV